MIDSWKARAHALKGELHALYLATTDRRVPWPAKVVAAMVLGYAFSPIDLIPDFIPILGYLDDLVIVPLGIFLLLKMIPAEVMAEARDRVRQAEEGSRPAGRTAAAVIVAVWVSALALSLYLVLHR